MGSFATMEPGARLDGAAPVVVDIFQAPEEGGWVAVCDDLPIATEAETVDALIERVWLIAPEIAVLNGRDGQRLSLRFVLTTRPVAA